MGASLITAPRSYSHSGDFHQIEVETDLAPPTPAAFTLTFNALGLGTPQEGETIELEWDGQKLTLTATSSPDNSGLQIPTHAGGPTTGYVELLVEWLRRVQLLTDDFDVSIMPLGAGLTILVEARQPQEMVMAFGGTATANVYIDILSTGTGFGQPNLTALVRVLAISASNEEVEIFLAQAPYDRNRRAAFNLRGAFDWLEAGLPSSGSIEPNVGSTLLNAAPANTVAKARLRYADRFGSGAPKAEAMLPTAFFYVIAGAIAGDAAGGFPYGASFFFLHNYRRRDGVAFRKPIAREQPDWLYFFSKNTATFSVSFTIAWSNGTTTTYTPAAGPGYSIEANSARWIQCGFEQCKLGSVAPPSPGLEIVGYSPILTVSGLHAPVIAHFDVVADWHPWQLFLLMETGLGGMESVYLRGKSEWKYTADREEYERSPSAENNLQLGERDTYLASARHVVEASTGWQQAHYIEHLRQILLGKTWIIDQVNNRFIRVIVETKTLDVKADDQDLFSLSITLSYAVKDAAFNNY